ncbi:MAG: aminotransferase class I/II-fold pyridoxal phosphate-dependent enzyme, partial [Acetatifactor sp.]|nr:aminotransferase class I/II-fold pyridoxal phosphate-dependent enzyme [Acetatifactor sp.]
LRQYLYENKQLVRQFVKENLPMIRVVPSNATYLLWLDCSEVTEDAEKLCSFIRQDSGLYLTEGEEYGRCGRQFIRMNAACPRERLVDGLNRLKMSMGKWRN